MLFNSYPFLLLFLPITLIGFFLCSRLSQTIGAAWLVACSIFFYGWWDHRYLLLLMGSIIGNYFLGGYISQNPCSLIGKRALTIGVIINLSVLAYYKYAGFFISSLSSALGASLTIPAIILPIGISFFTFTQIAFLVDAYVGKIREYRFVHYILFVTYFPHLIAGPVLHHKEMMPQFDDSRNYRPHIENFVIGFTIFTIGLAKKVLIADNLADYANPVFAQHAGVPSLFVAWGGALAYTLQLYFDFSGYSDMAIGLSRLFGVKLPLNFNSPYKARNIAEFWRRWHMTLSRFLRDYLYIPLGGNRRGKLRRHFNLMATMVLGGLWHGAGWNFMIWGALHGGFLILHQVWAVFTKKMPRPHWLPHKFGIFINTALTFTCVVFAWVYFRAPDIGTANLVVDGMLGASGVTLPDAIMLRLGSFGVFLHSMGVGSYLGGGASFSQTWCWILIAAMIVFFAPNTQQIMARFEPALPEHEGGHFMPAPHFSWLPSRRHAVAFGILLALGFLALSRPTEFLYFQF